MGASKKGWGRGRGKSRGRGHSHNGRGLPAASSPQLNNGIQGEPSAKQAYKGPRMPDGTRGFAVGRGRPLNSTTPPGVASSPYKDRDGMVL